MQKQHIFCSSAHILYYQSLTKTKTDKMKLFDGDSVIKRIQTEGKMRTFSQRYFI